MTPSPEFQEFTRILIIEIIKALVPVLGAASLAVLIALRNQILARLSFDQRWQFEALIKMLVRAAEQSGLKSSLLQTGSEKKQWVINTAQSIINSKGWRGISIEEIEAQIEASLLEGIHKPQPSTAESLPG